MDIGNCATQNRLHDKKKHTQNQHILHAYSNNYDADKKRRAVLQRLFWNLMTELYNITNLPYYFFLWLKIMQRK